MNHNRDHSDMHPRRPRVAILATLLVVLAIVLAACSSSSTPSKSSSTTPSKSSSSNSTNAAVSAAQAVVNKYQAEVTTYPAVPPIKGGIASLKGKAIWYVPLDGSLPIFQGMGAGIESAATAAGLTVHTCNGAALATTMSSCLNEAVTQGAAGVLSSYVDYAETPEAYNNLVAHHVPVLLAGTAPADGKTSSPQLAFYSVRAIDNVAVKVALDSVIANSKGKAHILFVGITDTRGTTIEAQLTNSFVAKACPQCTFVRKMYNTGNLSVVPSLVSAALLANPSTNYVVDEVDSGEPGTIQGIQSAGFTNKVQLVAISGTLQPLQYIASGNHQLSDVGLSPIYSGWQWVDALLQMMLGQQPSFVSPVIRLFDAQSVKGLTLTPQAYDTNAWYGPDTFETIFEKAWGLK